jgi:hypothetical protein
MEFSLPAWLGALCGMIAAAAIYVPVIRIVDRRWRKSSSVEAPEQRAAFEDKLSAVRRLILACDVALLAAAGYWLGNILGGRISGAP